MNSNNIRKKSSSEVLNSKILNLNKESNGKINLNIKILINLTKI